MVRNKFPFTVRNLWMLPKDGNFFSFCYILASAADSKNVGKARR